MLTGFRRHILCALCPLAFFTFLPLAAANAQDRGLLTRLVESVGLSSKPDKPLKPTRFVIGLDREAEYQVFSLSNPNRVVVELPDVKLSLPALPKAGPVGLVKSFHGGKAGKNSARIVIKVTDPVIVQSAKMKKVAGAKGYHLALDIVSLREVRQARASIFSRPSSLGAAGLQPPAPKPALTPDEVLKRTSRPIIVIDPGHGGRDSGARKHGTVEKDVVLKFSLALRDKLKKTGRYRIIMTRDDDSFVELGERIAIAERAHAQLFMAVHADYARSSASGAAIFSLRKGTANALKKSARRKAGALSRTEVASVDSSNGDKSVVQGILADLARREVDATYRNTNVFAQSMVEFMGTSTTMRPNPDRSAAFRVLKTAKLPSVLVELAFVTNKQDAARLRSNAWRDKVADSMVRAIDNYFANTSRRLPL